MQSVKYFLGSFGIPNPEFGVEPSENIENKLRSQYLSQGWSILSTHFVGAMRDANGHEIGYRILHVLVKEDQPVTVREPVKKDK